MNPMRISRKARIGWLTVSAGGLVVLMSLMIGLHCSRGGGVGPSMGVLKETVTRQIRDRHWIVSRRARDEYLKDLSRATQGVQLLPIAGAGKDSVDYLTIHKLAPDSPMYSAGFRRDDRILRINGTVIGTLDRAMNLVHEIRRCDHLSVQVHRGGLLMDYEFDFR